MSELCPASLGSEEGEGGHLKTEGVRCQKGEIVREERREPGGLAAVGEEVDVKPGVREGRLGVRAPAAPCFPLSSHQPHPRSFPGSR